MKNPGNMRSAARHGHRRLFDRRAERRGSSAHRSEPASRRRAAAAVHAGRDGG